MSEYSIVATLKVIIEDEKIRNTIFKAILPEIKVSVSPRVKVYCKCDDESLLLTFQAVDLTSLRAVMNSFLRLMYSVENNLIIATIGNSNKVSYHK